MDSAAEEDYNFRTYCRGHRETQSHNFLNNIHYILVSQNHLALNQKKPQHPAFTLKSSHRPETCLVHNCDCVVSSFREEAESTVWTVFHSVVCSAKHRYCSTWIDSPEGKITLQEELVNHKTSGTQ